MSDADRQIARLLRTVKRAVTDRKIYKRIGKMAKEIVTERTRRGFGVTEALGKKKRLPKLRPSTKSIRRSLKSTGGLTGPGATPNKSAFNRTGKTLDEIKVVPKADGVELKLSKHGINAVRDTEKINKDYNFMNLSRSEAKEIKKSLEKELRAKLKKFIN